MVTNQVNDESRNPLSLVDSDSSHQAEKRPGSISVAVGVDQFDLARPERIEAVSRAADKAYFGTILSGGVYGLGLVWVTGLFGVFGFGRSSPDYSTIFVLSLVGPVVGFIIAFFTTSFAHFAVLLFNWSMGGILSRRTTIVLIGGIAGYIPTCYFFVDYVLVGGTGSNYEIDAMMSRLFPVVLAMLVGQVGGVIGATCGGTWRNLKHELTFNAGMMSPKFQFKTGHMLKAMIWVSGILALDQLSSNHQLLVAVAILAILLWFTWSLDYLYFRVYWAKLLRA